MRRTIFILLILTVVQAATPALSQTAADLERQAQQAFMAAELDRAIELYRRLLARLDDPAQKADVLVKIAWIDHLERRDEAALESLTRALVLDLDYELATESYSSRDFDNLFFRARERAGVERYLAANDEVRHGNELLRGGDLDAAREAFTKALELSPDHPEGLYNLALADLRAERLEEATAGFERILTLADVKPDLFDDELRGLAYVNLGILYNRREYFGEAKKMLEQAVELLPRSVAAWSHLGTASSRLGEPREGARAFGRAVELAPDDTGLVDNLAQAHLDAGDVAAAVELLRRSTARFPRDVRLWFKLGLAELRGGDLGRSEDAFARALALDPDFAAARQNLEAVRARRQPSSPASSPAPPPPPPPSSLRPQLGLEFSETDYASLGIQGVGVAAIVPGSAASRADIRPGDLILKIDQEAVTSGEDVERYIARSGKLSFTVTLLRDNAPRSVELRFD